MELALTGREISAEKAMLWGLVNAVVEEEKEGGVVGEAIRWANEIVENSPDSVLVSKKGVDLGWEGGGVEEATDELVNGLWKGMESGENLKEGVKAFVEKRKPRWRDSKL